MLSYDMLKDRPRDFLAATSRTLGEFHQLLPAFQEAYAQRIPHELTRAGNPRYGGVGGGAGGSTATRGREACVYFGLSKDAPR